jgi:hypothetical protein
VTHPEKQLNEEASVTKIIFEALSRSKFHAFESNERYQTLRSNEDVVRFKNE